MELYSGNGGSSCSSSADGVFGTIQSEAGGQISPYDHHHQHKDDHIHDHHLQVNERQTHIISSGIEAQGLLVFPSSQSVVVNPPWPSSSTIPTTNTTICPIEDHHGGRIIDHSIQPQQQQTQLPIMSAGLLDDFHGGGGIRTMQFGYHGLGLQQSPPPMANFSNPLELYMAGTTCVVPDAFFRSSGHAKYMPKSATTLSPFGCSLQSELGKMTAQEIMDAKALAASKSHSEAERRRRERINAHLSRLRSLLPSTTKTDKASLLAEVIQHVKELKRQTSHIVEESPIPSESDELTVDAANDEQGKFVVKASMCCDDRSDLLTDLIKALKALNLKTLKAEITTLGGRVKNVLLITGDNNNDVDDETHQHQHHSISTVQDALKAVMDRSTVANINHTSSASSTTVAASGSGGTKRQRTTNLSSSLENRP